MIQSEWQERTKLLLGEKNTEKLKNAHVLVAGLGGVGSYAVELICRAGIGKITIIDSDKYQYTNINRQLNSFHSTVGKYKTNVISEKLYDINPDLNLKIYSEYIDKNSIDKFFTNSSFDYVIDAIDTILPKYLLINKCLSHEIKVVSSMGSAGKINPLLVQVEDISKSYNCRLAYYIRKKLHKEGYYSGFKVVFSPETVKRSSILLTNNEVNKKSIAGTISYIPAVFGMYCSYVVINELIDA